MIAFLLLVIVVALLFGKKAACVVLFLPIGALVLLVLALLLAHPHVT
jgi:hypothetical protein